MKSGSMRRKCVLAGLAALLATVAAAGKDPFTVVAANGIEFSEFRGYDTWQPVAPSSTDNGIKAIVANPVMINAYKAGFPGNGEPVPDCAMFAKIEWNGKKSAESPYAVVVPDTLKRIGLMVKDSKRFPDTNGWGYAQFVYDTASDSFTPGRKRPGIRKETLPSVPYAGGVERLRLYGTSGEVNT